MKRTPTLLALAGLGAALVIGIASYTLPPFPSEVRAASHAEAADERFIDVMPLPEPEEMADLAPHLSPEEARDYAARFLARAWPSEAELAARRPFPESQNVPSRLCGAYASAEATREIFEAPASHARRMKSEIFGLMSVRQVLETGDCSCAGKAAPWEPVPIILAALVKKHGNGTALPFNAYAEATRHELRAAERLCGGEF